MLVTHQERPRELKWYHAGPMLYGDWGTSRFYVLGLAFYYALHSSFWYVCGVGLLVAAVGWAYTIICRCYPDGGGVYSAAKHTSRQLAVVGALLLFADYIVTAALSAYDGMHYLGIPDHGMLVPACAMLAIILIGIINYIGPKKAGTFALIVALATLFLTLILVAFSIPHLAQGWHNITPFTQVPGSATDKWDNLVKVVLALSGVEAIANMTGIMVPPVTKTSKKAIWPVLIEVVVLNILLAIGMNALTNVGTVPAADTDAKVAAIQQAHPDYATNPEVRAQLAAVTPSAEQAERQDAIKNKVLRVMAHDFVNPWFAAICGIVFGLLLLSAVNTAVADMISIQYVMSRDTELPRFFTKLNGFGVPWLALLPAVFLPILILSIFQDLETLGDLYAIGVIGAITINLSSCSINKTMPLKKIERAGMALLALILGAIELTLAVEKPPALVFAGSVLVCGLVMRFATKTYPRLGDFAKSGVLAAAGVLLMAATFTAAANHDPVNAWVLRSFPILQSTAHATIVLLILGALLLLFSGSFASTALAYARGTHGKSARRIAQFRNAGILPVRNVGSSPVPHGNINETITTTLAKETAPAAAEDVNFNRPHLLVATRGARPLLDFAASYARDIRGILFILYVRQINVAFSGPVASPGLEEDPEAQTAFALAAEVAKEHNVPMIPMYVVSSDVADTILDFAATYNARALLMGVSRKASFLRALQGDVITQVADNLPNNIPLLIHA